MKERIAAFELYADNGAFEVIDPNVSGGQLEYDFYNHKYEFASGEAIFLTCGEYSNLAWVEVWLADKVEVGSDARYAVVVPFDVGNSGIQIDLNEAIPVNIPAGSYALIYELRYRDESADRDSGAFCRLTFVPQSSLEASELIPWDDQYFDQWSVSTDHPKNITSDITQLNNTSAASDVPTQLYSDEILVEYDRIEIIDYGLSDVIFGPERVGYQPFAQEHENYEF